MNIHNLSRLLPEFENKKTIDENLYTNIIMDNPTNINVLQMYLDTSNKLLEMIKDKNYDDFKVHFLLEFVNGFKHISR